ncbi:MAG: WD40 repeat domain-containing serine/threonine-protein kinase, partial [Planctomycetota bacterium]
PYFVMELVHGIPIDAFCAENKLTLHEMLQLFQQVCEAVHHAHRKGIIHRDIKPANVLVTVDSGKPLAKVIDFGIAKAMHLSLTDKTMFTEYGQIVGTLEYMSPEQALMSQDIADIRSDVYSLGALLYVLLTGSPPISREQLLERGIFELPNVMSDAKPPTPSLRLTGKNAARSWREHSESQRKIWSSSLQGDLDWITMKALSKELEQRYDSVADFSQDLGNFLRNEKVRARPPSMSYSIRKWMRRHRVAAFTSASLVGALLISLLAITLGYFQSQKNLDRVRSANELIKEKATELSRLLTEVEKQRNRADDSARQMALRVKRELLQSSWDQAFSGDAVSAGIQLQQIAEPDRDYAWKIVESVRTQMDWPSLRTESNGAIRQIAAHDASQQVAVVTSDSRLEIWDLGDRALSHEFQLPEAIYSCLAFTSSGERVLLGASDWVQEFDITTGKAGERLVHGRGGTRAAAFDDESKTWLITTGANFLLRAEARTLNLQNSIRLPERVAQIEISEDGEWGAVASLSGPIYLINLQGSKLASTLTHAGQSNLDLRWQENTLRSIDSQGRVSSCTIPNAGNEIPDNLKGELPDEFSVPGGEPLSSAELMADASLAVRQKSQIVLLAEQDDEPVEVPVRRFGPAISDLLWLPSSELLVVPHFNGRINLVSQQDILCRRNYATQLDGLNDGLCMASAYRSLTAHQDGRLIAWDTQTGVPLASQQFAGAVFSVDAFEKGNLLVSYGEDWSIRVMDLDTLQERWKAKTSFGVRSAAISNHGNLLAAAPVLSKQKYAREGTFDLWGMQNGKPRVRCQGHENWVLQFLFDSADESVYSLSVDGTIRRWNTQTGDCILEIDFSNDSPITSIGLLEAANQLLCGHQDGSLSLRSLDEGSVVGSAVILNNAVGGLLVCADERVAVVCTDSESSLTCLDTRSLEVIAEWDPRVGTIRGIRCDRSRSRLQILGEGVARILDLPQVDSLLTK